MRIAVQRPKWLTFSSPAARWKQGLAASPVGRCAAQPRIDLSLTVRSPTTISFTPVSSGRVGTQGFGVLGVGVQTLQSNLDIFMALRFGTNFAGATAFLSVATKSRRGRARGRGAATGDADGVYIYRAILRGSLFEDSVPRESLFETWL
jgi:hypothetical protein